MAIDPQIPLGIRPAHFDDPLESYTKAQHVANLIQQGKAQTQRLALGEQELAANKQTLADKQRASEADKKLGELIAEHTKASEDGSLATDDMGVIKGMATAGFGAKAKEYEANYRANQKQQIDNQKAKLETLKHKTEQIGAASQSLLALPDESLAQGYDQQRATLIQQGLITENEAPPAQSFGDPKALRQWLGQHAASAISAKDQIDQHQKDLDYAQKITEFNQNKLKDAPKTINDWRTQASGILGAAKNQEQWDAGLKTLRDAGATLGALFDFGEKYSPDAAARATQLGLTPEQRTQATATNARDTETQRHNKVEESLAASKNVRDQQVYNQTYGPGANEALVGVDPKLRVQATSAAQKAANEYQTASKSAEDIQTFINLVRSGNKAAGSNLPLVGVEALNALAGIKRINRAEIDQYEGAGSLLDKIQGRIGSVTSGQPIPPDVLNDIEALHKTLSGNAVKAYNTKLDGINQNYHAGFKPVPGAKAATGKVTVTAPDGSKHDFDSQAQADAFKKLAGIK